MVGNDINDCIKYFLLKNLYLWLTFSLFIMLYLGLDVKWMVMIAKPL